MKILHVTDYYTPESSSFIEESTKRLAERGHDVIVFTSNIHVYGKKRHVTAPKGVKLKRFRGKKIGQNDQRVIYPGVIKDLIKENPDVIHAYGLGYFSSFICGYLKFIKKTPLVLRADFNISEKSSFIKNIYNFFWKKIPMLNADVITVHIKKMKEILQKNYIVDPRKIEIMPHGIKFDWFNKAKDIRKKS